MVLARFDLTKTWRELVIAVSVPCTLFVVSFIALCIITRSVKVGDDAKMRCKYCADVPASDVEDDTANKYQCGIDPDPIEPCAIAGTSAVNSDWHVNAWVRRYLSHFVVVVFSEPMWYGGIDIIATRWQLIRTITSNADTTDKFKPMHRNNGEEQLVHEHWAQRQRWSATHFVILFYFLLIGHQTHFLYTHEIGFAMSYYLLRFNDDRSFSCFFFFIDFRSKPKYSPTDVINQEI